ncbi:hypothetical protein FB451DRAFT_1172202 [Mycena latifolia]|nr:hypothetical protein FB451DRAFT_1172202 [Mycena latifolia]
MVHPANFPAPPDTPNVFNWHPNLLHAHDILATAYGWAATLLRQEEGDPMRLRIHSEQIAEQLLPILEALFLELGDEAWIETAVTTFFQISVDLERSPGIAVLRDYALDELEFQHNLRSTVTFSSISNNQSQRFRTSGFGWAPVNDDVLEAKIH